MQTPVQVQMNYKAAQIREDEKDGLPTLRALYNLSYRTLHRASAIILPCIRFSQSLQNQAFNLTLPKINNRSPCRKQGRALN